jgi:hypothetical protein
MKHPKLFESDVMTENLLFTVDAIQEFPELYPPESRETDPDLPEETGTVSVYSVPDGMNPTISDDDFHTHIDPSFRSEPVKLKIIYSWEDQFGYSGDHNVYMGLPGYSKEAVINWFHDLLEDDSRDYLSL